MSYHVAIYRRAFWLPDAPTLQQILEALVGGPPWSASLRTAEAVSVGSAELVVSLIEEELAGSPRLLPADLQRVVIAAHGRTLVMDRRWAEIEGEASGLLLACSPIPLVKESVRSLADAIAAEYVLASTLSPDASGEVQGSPITHAYVPSLPAAGALETWGAVAAHEDRWFRAVSGRGEEFDAQAREIARLVGLGRPLVRATSTRTAQVAESPPAQCPVAVSKLEIASPSYLLTKPSEPAPLSPAPGVPAPSPAPVIASAPDPRALPDVLPAASTGTEEIDLRKLRDIVMANPTPFVGATSPERLAELRAEAEGAEETVMQRAPSSEGEDVDETMMMPTPGLRTQIAALPFEPAFPELDVERYAALVAELQVKGATAEVLARYRVTAPAALIALKAEQERRFAAAPAQRTRFEQRVAHFLSFMRPGSSR